VVTAKDIEECYKAERRWFEANGKPVHDTNARYGLTDHDDDGDDDDDDDDGHHHHDGDIDRVNGEGHGLDAAHHGDVDPDFEASSDSATDSSLSEHLTKRKMERHHDGGDGVEWRSRSRDSSVMARDEFAGRRAESEPPPTWHRNLGIPWYRQFEDVPPDPMEQEAPLSDSTNSESDSESVSGSPSPSSSASGSVSASGSDGDVDDDDSVGDLQRDFGAIKLDDDDTPPRGHCQQSSIIFHGDVGDGCNLKEIGALSAGGNGDGDGIEDKDEEDPDDGQDEDVLLEHRKEEEQKQIAMDIKEDLDPVPDLDETKMDQIASLPHFPENGQGAAARFRAPSASINSTHSHSRASSSASTFDID